MTFSILETISVFVLSVIKDTGYLGVFALMFLESMNLPIPSEIIMPFSGFLAAIGVFSFWPVVFTGAFGNLAGSLFSYWLGFLFRKGFIKDGRLADVEKAKEWTLKFGDWAAFVSRLLPIVRTFISFPLGVLGGRSVWKFSIFTFSGAFIWSLFLAWLGFILGENWGDLEAYFRKFDYIVLIVILAGIGLLIYEHFKHSKQDA